MNRFLLKTLMIQL